MRMLRTIKGKTLKDYIGNQTIRNVTGVKIEEFLREQRLRWFAHVKRMNDEGTPVKVKHFVVDGSKKGRPKKRWKEVEEKNIKTC